MPRTMPLAVAVLVVIPAIAASSENRLISGAETELELIAGQTGVLPEVVGVDLKGFPRVVVGNLSHPRSGQPVDEYGLFATFMGNRCRWGGDPFLH